MQDQARAELGHRWGLGVSRAADPRGPSSGWPHTESHVHPPSITEGSPAPSQPQEGKWGSREQHVPFTGSTQGAQVDQATEQGQGSASWQEPGPCCPLAAGCSHGGAASSTTVGLSSEERERVAVQPGVLGSPRQEMVLCDPCSTVPEQGVSLDALDRDISLGVPFSGQRLPLPESPQHFQCPAQCSATTRENFRFWFLLKKKVQQNQQDSSSQVATAIVERRCSGALKTLWRHPKNDRGLSGVTGTPLQAVGWG